VVRAAGFSFNWRDCCSQELQIPATCIMEFWKQRKISAAVAMRDLLVSRDPVAERWHRCVQWVSLSTSVQLWRDCARVIQEQLVATLNPAREHPRVNEWLAQFRVADWRYKLLLLSGPSRIGKSIRAKTLFDPMHYFLVNCQGLGDALPSLREFDRAVHQVIIWDEISPQQVLATKVVFQGGVDLVSMSQSRCNNFSYQVWLWQVPQVLCSNYFPLVEVAADAASGRQGISAESADWLSANIIDAALPDGVRWYDMSEEPVSKRARTESPEPARFLP
jgi:hypothetical protein